MDKFNLEPHEIANVFSQYLYNNALQEVPMTEKNITSIIENMTLALIEAAEDPLEALDTVVELVKQRKNDYPFLSSSRPIKPYEVAPDGSYLRSPFDAEAQKMELLNSIHFDPNVSDELKELSKYEQWSPKDLENIQEKMTYDQKFTYILNKISQIEQDIIKLNRR